MTPSEMLTFDMAAKMAEGLPAPAGAWSPIPKYSFVGGNNDSPSVPVGGLTEAAMAVLAKHGSNLATYNLGGNPQGFEGLRSFVAESLAANAHMPTDPDQVLVVSGSLQALDLGQCSLPAAGRHRDRRRGDVRRDDLESEAPRRELRRRRAR